MCQVWCSSIQGIYARLQEAICHVYMCIVLYMKLIWCNGCAEIYVQLEKGELMQCNGFVEIYAQLEGVNWT